MMEKYIISKKKLKIIFWKLFLLVLSMWKPTLGYYYDGMGVGS